METSPQSLEIRSNIKHAPNFQIKEVIPVFFNQSLTGKAIVGIIADYNMVQDLNLHNTGGIDQVSGHLFIILAGLGTTGGVVMNKNQGDGTMLNRPLYNLTRGDDAAIYRTGKGTGNVNNLVLAI